MQLYELSEDGRPDHYFKHIANAFTLLKNQAALHKEVLPMEAGVTGGHYTCTLWSPGDDDYEGRYKWTYGSPGSDDKSEITLTEVEMDDLISDWDERGAEDATD